MMLNVVLDGMVPKLGGLENLEEGMFVVAAMIPIGAGLHDPVTIC